MNYRTLYNRPAAEELRLTLEGLDLAGTVVSMVAGDVAMALPDGTSLRLSAVPTHSTSPTTVRALIEARDGQAGISVLIADRVSTHLAEMLQNAGVGWLDRRGHLRLVHGGVVIDTDVAPLRAPPSSALPKDACATPVGREVALELLMAPGEPRSVRGLAKVLGRAPSSVSAVLRALQGEGLVDGQRQPRTPELFWALAGAWHPRRFSLRGCPDPADPDDDWSYELHGAELDVAGWALSDTRAAISWGVPLVASGDYPPDLYVPDETVLVRAMQHFGESAVVSSRACTLALAPAPAVCALRSKHRDPWPLAHPVVVALDLALDPGRGSEALDDWNPNDVQRVW